MGSTSSEVLILGGGFAGLSCGVRLAASGLRVTLLEKKPRLGGRAYSFLDRESRHPVDNGQHLFMGCYRHTRSFLAAIGTEGLLRFSGKVRVDFADSEGGRDALRCPSSLGSPWHLAWGVLGMGLSLGDKLGLVRLARELRGLRRRGIPPELDRLSVRQWLEGLGQSRPIQERLLDPIALGALNEDPRIAAATGLAQALLEMFFRDAEGSRLGLSCVGLSQLYPEAARKYIEERGGRILTSKRIKAIYEAKGRVGGAVTESGESFASDSVVSTLPPWDLSRLDLPQALRGPWRDLMPSPIVSLCLWLDRPVLEEPLVGLIGTEVQWVFNKSLILGLGDAQGQYLSLVISGARRHLGWSPAALRELAQRDLSRCFPVFKKARILRWKVVKEPFATLSPAPGSDRLRPAPGTGMPGLLLAGDWTRTGLPATIESAVLSGHRAAELVLAQEDHTRRPHA